MKKLILKSNSSFSGVRKKLKSSNDAGPVPRKPKGRSRGGGGGNKKRGQKFSEFARNFSQYDSDDSDNSVDSLESFHSSLGGSVVEGLDGEIFNDDTKSLDSPILIGNLY